MLSAISAVLLVLEIQLPFSPPFVKFDFQIYRLCYGILLEPLAGILITCMKILLNFLINGSTTIFVGELSNLILTSSFVLPASYVYEKEKKNAIKNLVIRIILIYRLAIKYLY